MRDHSDIRADLEPGIDRGEVKVLVAVAHRLQDERPVPAAAFRGDLARRLQAMMGRRNTAPQRLRLAIAAYVGSGSLLLAIPAIGLLGAGPFAS
jgi:hypothetical protein